MTTIKDVARVANVSIATVSRVVNNGPKVGEKTRHRVLQVMSELGYTPNATARALVTQQSDTIGVVIPELTDPFFASLANGVEQVACSVNRQLLLSTAQVSADGELQAIKLLQKQRCEVIVAHVKMLPDEMLVQLSEEIPGLVFIDRHIEKIEHKCVWLENEEGGRVAARHFLALNHKELAVISSNYKIDDPNLRVRGFKQIVEQAGLILDPELCVSSEPTLKGGEIAVQKLLTLRKSFSALFVYNDAMAIGAISVLEDNGFKVPEHISVIGFDDVLLSQYSRPKLTTLHYPIETMARNAAELALFSRTGKCISSNFQHKYIPTLVKRESAMHKSK